jgi:hypothetical protein
MAGQRHLGAIGLHFPCVENLDPAAGQHFDQRADQGQAWIVFGSLLCAGLCCIVGLRRRLAGCRVAPHRLPLPAVPPLPGTLADPHRQPLDTS